jgi:hypothetical protein
VPPTFGFSIQVHIDLLRPIDGGRSTSITSGYRPLCIFDKADGVRTIIGLCELDLDGELAPGESRQGRLSFDVAVSEEVRALVRVGSKFGLAEGPHRIGSAEVRGMDP